MIAIVGVRLRMFAYVLVGLMLCVFVCVLFAYGRVLLCMFVYDCICLCV